MENFVTPPNHINFSAIKLFENIGEIVDGSIAYLEKDGGGPTEFHAHDHNHVFIVIKGEIIIKTNDHEIVVKENSSMLVNGLMPHSVWNNLSETAIVVGLSVK